MTLAGGPLGSPRLSAPKTDPRDSMAEAAVSSASYDVVIIGGGPGGYNAAIRAGQLGLTAA